LTKLLFITSRFPYPLTKGDRLRVFFQLKSLSEEHEVHLVALNETTVSPQDLAAVSPFCKSVTVFVLPVRKRILPLLMSPLKRLPLQVAFFYHPGIHRKIENLIAEISPDHIHCHLIRTTEYVKNIRSVSRSLDFMDAFGKGMERRETTARNFLKRLLFRYEKYQLYSYENRVFNFIDSFAIISDQDKQAIPNGRRNELCVVPNGVDFDAFYPREAIKKYDLLFMGNLGYPPNIDAIHFLVKEILPIARKHRPDLKLLIAGIDPPKSIQKLQSENTDVITDFPHISDSIACSKIMVAPMRLSIGLQNKILQAMAMNVPCIVSSLSNNAIKAPNGEAIIEAITAAEFSEEILRLLNDEVQAQEIADKGFSFVKEHYSWETQHGLFMNLLPSNP